MNNPTFEAELKEIGGLAERIRATDQAESSVLIGEYLRKLESLISQGWDYALGKENEVADDLLPAVYRSQRERVLTNLQIELARIAQRYRSLPVNSVSDKQVVDDYHAVFKELVRIAGKIVALDPDAELPDRLMPKEYVAYWLS